MHTPGPWSIDPSAANHVIALGARRPICSINFFDSSKPNESRTENEANARLIAEAPSMLGVLQQFSKGYNEASSVEEESAVAAVAEIEFREIFARIEGKADENT